MSDSDANTVQTYEYSVYGQVAASTNFLTNPYMFTGRRFDLETGLYFLRARYYNPHIGRFMQTDPVGYGAGINWYLYCSNNPIGYADPLGLYENDENYDLWGYVWNGSEFYSLWNYVGGDSWTIDAICYKWGIHQDSITVSEGPFGPEGPKLYSFDTATAPPYETLGIVSGSDFELLTPEEVEALGLEVPIDSEPQESTTESEPESDFDYLIPAIAPGVGHKFWQIPKKIQSLTKKEFTVRRILRPTRKQSELLRKAFEDGLGEVPGVKEHPPKGGMLRGLKKLVKKLRNTRSAPLIIIPEFFLPSLGLGPCRPRGCTCPPRWSCPIHGGLAHP